MTKDQRTGSATVALFIAGTLATVALARPGLPPTRLIWGAVVGLTLLALSFYLWPEPASAKKTQMPGEREDASPSVIDARTRDEDLGPLRPEERIFIDQNPAELASYYRDRLEIEADAIVQSFIGKWIRTELTLTELRRPASGDLSFMGAFQGATIVSGDAAQHHRDRFVALRRGATFRVIGRLRRVGDTGIDLAEAEIEAVDPSPIPSPH